MDKKAISVSHKMKGILDDDYTLYDDGSVLHFYDKHTYPGGQNIEENLTVDDLSTKIKQRLYDAASDENKELVRTILKLT
jgi:hypothetical protein